MAYNNETTRADSQALIPEVVVNEIIKNVETQSAAMQLFTRSTMSTNQTRMPVLQTLPVAYFVTGDTGLKQTTEMAWTNKYINAEELAVIVPVAENVLDDVKYDLWGEIRPKVEEAIGRALDSAIFFGTNKPASWPSAISTAAIAAANYYARGTSNAATGGIAQDIAELMATVEADGFDVNGFVTSRAYKRFLRGARDTTGQKLLDVGLGTIEGEKIVYAMPGLWPTGSSAAEMFAGDWSQFVLAVRKDITWKVLDQAVIQDNTGAIIFNLAQQDMIALRITFRAGWQVANPITHEAPTESDRYPVAVMRAPA